MQGAAPRHAKAWALATSRAMWQSPCSSIGHPLRLARHPPSGGAAAVRPTAPWRELRNALRPRRGQCGGGPAELAGHSAGLWAGDASGKGPASFKRFDTLSCFSREPLPCQALEQAATDLSADDAAMARFQAGLHSPHLCGPYAAQEVDAPCGPSGLQVYCDLDGVLCDFNKGCLALFPEGGSIAEKIPTHLVTRLSHEEETEMWRRVEQPRGFVL